MTLGTDRVRLNFLPADTVTANDVIIIKQLAADGIDWCVAHQLDVTAGAGNPERTRLLALAMTAFDEAAMWATKAIT